ncbi:hypothetical protein A2Y83_03385 [Candidatus Falkowbacteria bacterium RBG_13_39_14]|uniref:Uncharacterized protein n=1 Tax=Candidatus Falkowbacteria bacterium RBG_13_39_14 TaxID=1797985 RepID=A0A1F5S6I6_9BACT|nr:MAG: hypothetical protein A2Y83_03385 [Candidatus Falkowbacteria bacterium RBG_13_39_14]
MTSKRTILSNIESELLKTLLAKYGEVVDFDKIFLELKALKSRQEVRNLVSKLVKNGWLARIKQGLYYIASLEAMGNTALSVFVIAYLLENQSYVSFEGALQYHGMFDQHLKAITSVTLKGKKQREVQGTQYVFVHTKKENFTGWETRWEYTNKMQIAAAEKALLDMLAHNRSFYAADLVMEKLQEYHRDINWDRFIKLAKTQSITVQRIAGFFLDKFNIESSELLGNVSGEKSASFITKDSKKFIAKWRLYAHNHFI